MDRSFRTPPVGAEEAGSQKRQRTAGGAEESGSQAQGVQSRASPPPPQPLGPPPPQPPPPSGSPLPTALGDCLPQGYHQQQQKQQSPRFQGRWKASSPSAPKIVPPPPLAATVETASSGPQAPAVGLTAAAPTPSDAAVAEGVPTAPTVSTASTTVMSSSTPSAAAEEAAAAPAAAIKEGPPEGVCSGAGSDPEGEEAGQKEVHLDQREEVISELQAKLNAYNKVLEEQRDQQVAAVENLRKVLQGLDDRANSLALAKENLKEKDASLDKRATDLAWREKDLAFREEMLERRDKLLADHELEAEDKERTLEEKERTLGERVR
eukprot:XP_008666133.1 synapsin-1-like [Zea mays]